MGFSPSIPLIRSCGLLRGGHCSHLGGRESAIVEMSIPPSQCRTLPLTAKEFTLLSYLIANAGTALSRSGNQSNVWEQNSEA